MISTAEKDRMWKILTRNAPYKNPKVEFIKVWWHCLMRTFKLLKEDHRICSSSINNYKTRYFCTCGYNNGGAYLGTASL